MCKLEKNKWRKLDLRGTLKKTEKKRGRCILTLSHFLAEIIYILPGL